MWIRFADKTKWPSYKSCWSGAYNVMVAPGCWRGLGCCAATPHVSTAPTDRTNTAARILVVMIPSYSSSELISATTQDQQPRRRAPGAVQARETVRGAPDRSERS